MKLHIFGVLSSETGGKKSWTFLDIFGTPKAQKCIKSNFLSFCVHLDSLWFFLPLFPMVDVAFPVTKQTHRQQFLDLHAVFCLWWGTLSWAMSNPCRRTATVGWCSCKTFPRHAAYLLSSIQQSPGDLRGAFPVIPWVHHPVILGIWVTKQQRATQGNCAGPTYFDSQRNERPNCRAKFRKKFGQLKSVCELLAQVFPIRMLFTKHCARQLGTSGCFKWTWIAKNVGVEFFFFGFNIFWQFMFIHIQIN